MPDSSSSSSPVPPASSTASPASSTAPTPPSPPTPSAGARQQLIGQSLALEAVSQAAAMAVQDAGSYFRQVAAVSAAAVAVFTAKMVETQSPSPWSDLIAQANNSVTAAASAFQTVGGDAANVIRSFTS